jgi:hypothetical protein
MKTNRAILIIFLATLWGFLEATLGGALHLANIPFTGTIMSSIGFCILFAAIRGGVSAYELPVISIVAASFKFLDCALFGLPALHITVVNPATAIAAQGLAAMFTYRWLKRSDAVMNIAPALLVTAAISVATFNLVSLYMYGWQTDHTKQLLNTALVQLPLMAVLSTALVKLSSLIKLDLATPRMARFEVACATAFVCIIIAVKLF